MAQSADSIIATTIGSTEKAVVKVLTRTSSGAGIFINDQGLILTSNHVVRQSARVVLIDFDRNQFSGVVVDRNLQLDIAIIQADIPSATSYLEMQRQSIHHTQRGDKLFLVGHPSIER